MKTIRGKKAVVTGAAGGLGRAFALALVAEGADVYLLDIDDAKLASTVAEASQAGVVVAGAHCDVARPQEITATVQTILGNWGHVDILVNNAGVAYFGPTAQMTASQWEWLLGINLLAPIQFTRELLPTLLARDEAHIVNVCSIAGLISQGKLAAYHVSKFGLVGFSGSLRAEYGARGLGVTALCPGFVRTNLFQAALTSRTSKPGPPRWLSTSPERVAARAIQAIRRNHGLALVTPMAYGLWYLQRLSPRLMEWLTRSRTKDQKARETERTGRAESADFSAKRLQSAATSAMLPLIAGGREHDTEDDAQRPAA